MTDITSRLEAVKQRIEKAASACGRDPATVRLLAVSKTRPAADIRAAQAAGQRAFGENYLQDALPKIVELAGAGLEWHFIGAIQSNKTRDIAEHFDWVHTVDREKIARRLDGQRPAGMAPLNICLQVNISGEASKAGVSPAKVLPLARAVAGLPRLRLRGLMAIPAATADVEAQRAAFRALREIHEQLVAEGFDLDTLSMGMSDDLEAAIAEGSTLVRIGTAIFGARDR
ncbi:YggS family pyridoxal phosphate-dependent enzyme [Sulfuriflexus sp.]|uniref:YggS family pyridoxal phosphate-dependent enzyme n=1 Tax=Sulfuriflexus sp. TaxID=2015443 RepID=UPI0028CF88E7|nr:YggS family pyridoxal phosphate-dependent enzyme [Sulfuriflexus sp.]MDT8404612.1 YggS family pyridoxal phosphate-dependent enzyme [Sulfuriflexus sp.]